LYCSRTPRNSHTAANVNTNGDNNNVIKLLNCATGNDMTLTQKGE